MAPGCDARVASDIENARVSSFDIDGTHGGLSPELPPEFTRRGNAVVDIGISHKGNNRTLHEVKSDATVEEVSESTPEELRESAPVSHGSEDDSEIAAPDWSDEWYEEEGRQRRYYYVIDMSGRLFLETVYPKTVASSLKDVKFLNFFFKQLRANDQHFAVPEGHIGGGRRGEDPQLR